MVIRCLICYMIGNYFLIGKFGTIMNYSVIPEQPVIQRSILRPDCYFWDHCVHFQLLMQAKDMDATHPLLNSGTPWSLDTISSHNEHWIPTVWNDTVNISLRCGTQLAPDAPTAYDQWANEVTRITGNHNLIIANQVLICVCVTPDNHRSDTWYIRGLWIDREFTPGSNTSTLSFLTLSKLVK